MNPTVQLGVALARELEIALRAAVEAGRLALQYQGRGVTVEAKPDLSPVTAADREGERLIAGLLSEAFPEDGLLGEEGAARESASGRRWIIDPIDGTRDFLRGLPNWGVLIGLEDAGEVTLGVCHLPALNETCFAARGGGAFRNNQRIRVSGITGAADSMLLVNGLNQALRAPFGPRLLGWMEQFGAVRSFGGCQDAMMVAGGRAEAWLEPAGKPWDFAALKIIAEEAGAVFFDFDGRATIYGGNCVISTPAFEAELRRFVTGAQR